jgi:carbon-monoxide dehydrogenase small subunit
MLIKFILNSKPVEVDVKDSVRAVDLLREYFLLTGPKEGCGSGECGACAVWIDGVTKLSCLMLAPQLHGRNVTTVEGLGKDQIHPIQQSFAKLGAVQCGYCTPGMVMSAAELLKRNKTPDRDVIRNEMSGNLCRCTGYHKIVDAVEDAAHIQEKK